MNDWDDYSDLRSGPPKLPDPFTLVIIFICGAALIVGLFGWPVRMF